MVARSSSFFDKQKNTDYYDWIYENGVNNLHQITHISL